MKIHNHPLAIGLATAVAGLGATASPQASAAKAELHVEVATHTMPGMGGLGTLGRITGNLSGGTASYGQARHPGMPGHYLDIALVNEDSPGTTASLAIPKGLRLGDSIDLRAPERIADSETGGTGNDGATGLADGRSQEIRYYWGCGKQVRGGQPRTVTTAVRNGKPVVTGHMPQPRTVPQLGIDPGPAVALWPNPSSRKSVSGRASLTGAHRLTGGGVAQAIDFEVDRSQDFMPELELDSTGSAAEGIALAWNGVDGAKAYFIQAMGMDGDAVVMWSSAEDGVAGPELMAYLPGNTLSQWLGTRALLSPETRSCGIPEGIFSTEPMVQMIAYGSTRTIEGENWRVHLRNKSTTTLMGGGVAPAGAAKDAGKSATKGLLRGLIGR